MVQDVRNYISNLDLTSPPAADREVQDWSVKDLLQQIRQTTNRDAAANRNSSDPPILHLSTIHRMTRLGEAVLFRLSKAALQGQVVVLIWMVAPAFRRLVLHREVEVALAVAPRHVVDVMHAVAAVALHLVVGVVILRRNVLLPDRLNKHLTPGPSAHYDA